MTELGWADARPYLFCCLSVSEVSSISVRVRGHFFGGGITLRDALGLLLALYSGIMPGDIQETLWFTKDQTYISLMQDQVPGTRCTAS